jgi:hypothetical protein
MNVTDLENFLNLNRNSKYRILQTNLQGMEESLVTSFKGSKFKKKQVKNF